MCPNLGSFLCSCAHFARGKLQAESLGCMNDVIKSKSTAVIVEVSVVKSGGWEARSLMIPLVIVDSRAATGGVSVVGDGIHSGGSDACRNSLLSGSAVTCVLPCT